MSIHPAAWVVWTLCAGLIALDHGPFYLLVVFAAAWVVHAAHRHAGPGIRSFRIFAAFGLLTIATRTALVFLGPVSKGSVVAAMLEGARLAVMLVVYGTFNSVSDPWRLMRLAPRRFHEPAHPFSRCRSPSDDRCRSARAGSTTTTRHPGRSPAQLAGPGGPRSIYGHGGSRDSGGEHGHHAVTGEGAGRTTGMIPGTSIPG